MAHNTKTNSDRIEDVRSAKPVWDDLFASRVRVSDDFMTKRRQPKVEEREKLCP